MHELSNWVRTFVDVVLQGRLPDRLTVHGFATRMRPFKIEFVKDRRTLAYMVTAGGRVPLTANGVANGMNRATFWLQIPNAGARITSIESSNGVRVTISRRGVPTVVAPPRPRLPNHWPVGRSRLAPNANLENAVYWYPLNENALYIGPNAANGLVRQVYSNNTMRKILEKANAAGIVESPYTRKKFTANQVYRLAKPGKPAKPAKPAKSAARSPKSKK
jgi:hypothetical protein